MLCSRAPLRFLWPRSTVLFRRALRTSREGVEAAKGTGRAQPPQAARLLMACCVRCALADRVAPPSPDSSQQELFTSTQHRLKSARLVGMLAADPPPGIQRQFKQYAAFLREGIRVRWGRGGMGVWASGACSLGCRVQRHGFLSGSSATAGHPEVAALLQEADCHTHTQQKKTTSACPCFICRHRALRLPRCCERPSTVPWQAGKGSGRAPGADNSRSCLGRHALMRGKAAVLCWNSNGASCRRLRCIPQPVLLKLLCYRGPCNAGCSYSL
jgi:hypothetical protein